MTHLERYIVEQQGFVHINGPYGNYSTMIPGCLYDVYEKDGIRLYFGLGEVKLPPTLLYTRLIILNDDLSWGGTSIQQSVDIVLKRYTPEQIFNAIMETEKYIETGEGEPPRLFKSEIGEINYAIAQGDKLK